MARFTPAAEAVLREARAAAQQFGYPFIQREQLFLGLLTDESVGRILTALGVDVQSVRQAILDRILPGTGAADDPDTIPLLPTARQVYRGRAKAAATLLGHTQIGPADLLLGFLLEQHGTVAEVVRASGITSENVLAEIKRLDQ